MNRNNKNEELYICGRLLGNGLVRWTPVISKTQALQWAYGGNKASKLM
jgi:hypothetical protein